MALIATEPMYFRSNRFCTPTTGESHGLPNAAMPTTRASTTANDGAAAALASLTNTWLFDCTSATSNASRDVPRRRRLPLLLGNSGNRLARELDAAVHEIAKAEMRIRV